MSSPWDQSYTNQNNTNPWTNQSTNQPSQNCWQTQQNNNNTWNQTNIINQTNIPQNQNYNQSWVISQNPWQSNQTFSNNNNQYSQYPGTSTWNQQSGSQIPNSTWNQQSGYQAPNPSWKQHSGWGIRSGNSTMPQSKNIVYPNNIQYFQPNQMTQSKTNIDLSKSYFIATSIDQSMVVDISQNPGSLNTLQLSRNSKKAHQKFKIKKIGQQYELINENSGLALGIENGSPADGAPITANQATNSIYQRWKIIEAKQEKGFFIQTFCGKCWDLCEWKTSEGTPIFQYKFNGGRNQVWILKDI